MKADHLRSYGMSLLVLALAVGGLARTLHVSESAQIAMTAVSILLSLCAIGLFVKSMLARRQ